ncbi:MAG: hypothetical protein ACI4QU_04055, partial [Christensenellales bacterium]
VYIPYVDKLAGEYIKPSDFTMAIGVNNIMLEYDIESSSVSYVDSEKTYVATRIFEIGEVLAENEVHPDGSRYVFMATDNFNALNEMELNLVFEGGVSFHAAALDDKGLSNVVDLSGLAALVLGEESSLANTNLTIRIKNDMDMEFTVGMYIYLDLKNFETMEAVLTLNKVDKDTGVPERFLSLYIAPTFDAEGEYQ